MDEIWPKMIPDPPGPEPIRGRHCKEMNPRMAWQYHGYALFGDQLLNCLFFIRGIAAPSVGHQCILGKVGELRRGDEDFFARREETKRSDEKSGIIGKTWRIEGLFWASVIRVIRRIRGCLFVALTTRKKNQNLNS